MFIEAVDDEFDYEVNGIEKKAEGPEGQRTYVLLESGELCRTCLKNSRMQELGIEKISFQIYQIAEKKLFDLDFRVASNNGKMVNLHFSDRIVSVPDNVEIFEAVKMMATNVGAAGLERIANQTVILAAKPRPLPPDKDSAYLRCMDACDNIEFEPFKLLCYALCLAADDTPGS